MPNWCNNNLRIYGDPLTISRLPWNESSLLFQPLLPLPQGLTPENQYRWAIEHWSVKWDCFIDIVDRSEDYLELQFDTPWTAPKIGIDSLALMFPSLNFELRSQEPGCDWRASFYWEKGILIEEINRTFYRQSPLICPECQSDYYPEIDLDGTITYSECHECGWCC